MTKRRVSCGSDEFVGTFSGENSFASESPNRIIIHAQGIWKEGVLNGMGNKHR